MNRSTSFRKGLACLTAAIVLTPFALFAAGDTTLVDDLEGGKNENRLGQYWYYYDDSADKGTSKVTNATETDADGKPVMKPTKGQGHEGDYAAEISWDFGENQPLAKGKYKYSQMVGIGTMLCADGDEVDISSGTTLKFWVKAKKAMKLYIEIASADVSESTEPFAFLCQTNKEVTTTWTQIKLNFSDFGYPSWWTDAPAEIEPSFKRATKIQFKVDKTVEEEPNADDVGTMYIDDVVLEGVYIPPFGVCGTCPGAAGQMSGLSPKTVFSDFEKGLTQNAAKYYWYVFDDKKTNTGTISKFTAGTKLNEDLGADELVIDKDATDGYDASKGLKVSYKLGTTYVDAKSTTIDPFCGVGSMFSNYDVYEKDNTVALKSTDGSKTTGIYFDYKTDKPIKFELYTQLEGVTLPEGAAFYTKLMPTEGAWKGATIKWTDLVLPGWKEVQELGTVNLNLKKLLKMQIQIQNAAGTEGTLQIDNIAFLGEAVYPTPGGAVRHFAAGKAGAGISSMMTSKGLNVTLMSLPAGTHNGVVELLGTNGRVIAKQNVSVNGTSSLTLTTGKLPAGVYMLKVNTIYGNGKTFSNSSRVSILN